MEQRYNKRLLEAYWQGYELCNYGLEHLHRRNQ